MATYLVGTCCCGSDVEFNSLSMTYYHTPGNPSNPITSAKLTLYYYEQLTTDPKDVTFDVDISPLNGKSVPEMWNQDWTLDLLLNGQVVGYVVYHFVSGSNYQTFVVDITVYYAGYVFTATGCTAQEFPLEGLTVQRHVCTQTPAN